MSDKTKEVLKKIFIPPLHVHLSWFGSDLACSYCNPYCYQNHQISNPNKLKDCGDPNCPMNPKNFSGVPSTGKKQKKSKTGKQNATAAPAGR